MDDLSLEKVEEVMIHVKNKLGLIQRKRRKRIFFFMGSFLSLKEFYTSLETLNSLETPF